jgi:hypothetical protein
MTISKPVFNPTHPYALTQRFDENSTFQTPAPPPLFPYPSHHFPGLLGQVMQDLCAGGSIPPELVGTQLIVYASLAAQGVADVAWPNEAPMPIGVSAAMGVASSAGKSLVKEILEAPFKNYFEMHQDPEVQA